MKRRCVITLVSLATLVGGTQFSLAASTFLPKREELQDLHACQAPHILTSKEQAVLDQFVEEARKEEAQGKNLSARYRLVGQYMKWKDYRSAHIWLDNILNAFNFTQAGLSPQDQLDLFDAYYLMQDLTQKKRCTARK